MECLYQQHDQPSERRSCRWPPNDYLSTVQIAISALPLEAEDHWLSFYGANLKGDLTIDARLDNQTWPELNEQLAALDWPPTDGFYSTRNFILLRPAKS